MKGNPDCVTFGRTGLILIFNFGTSAEEEGFVVVALTCAVWWLSEEICGNGADIRRSGWSGDPTLAHWWPLLTNTSGLTLFSDLAFLRFFGGWWGDEDLITRFRTIRGLMAFAMNEGADPPIPELLALVFECAFRFEGPAAMKYNISIFNKNSQTKSKFTLNVSYPKILWTLIGMIAGQWDALDALSTRPVDLFNSGRWWQVAAMMCGWFVADSPGGWWTGHCKPFLGRRNGR